MNSNIQETDVADAKDILNKFNDCATYIKEKNNFEVCANIVYGNRLKIFDVLIDSNHRMFFKCNACKKDMNNTRSLNEHAKSGNHLKTVDNDPHLSVCSNERRRKIIYTNRNSLQYMLSKCDIPVIGLHLVEEYSHYNWSKRYFVCILCGIHGKQDDMYEHLIGNNHTDTYLKSKLMLKCQNITNKERVYLREAISRRDNYSIEDIVLIKDPVYYPQHLDDDKYLKAERRDSNLNDDDGEKESCTSEKAVSSKHSENIVPGKKEILDDVSLEHASDVETCDISCMTDIVVKDDYEERLSLLYEMIRAHKEQEYQCRLISVSDVVICLRLMFACLHFLYFANAVKKTMQKSNQTKVIKKCMARINYTMVDFIKKKFDLDVKLVPSNIDDLD